MANVLIGSVKVQPTMVKPGEPVLIQVLDPTGKAYTTDTAVRITIQGVEVPWRYYQFATAGKRTLVVRAIQGTNTETATAEVQVSGDPVVFRRTLGTPPLTAMPILQLSQSLGSPYLASFSLATPSTILPAIAKLHPTTAPGSPTPAVTQMAAAEQLSVFSKALATLPADRLLRSPSTAITTATGIKVTGMGQVALGVDFIAPTPVETSYSWDFGDGQTATTQSPTVTHDYFPAIKAGKVPHPFDVACTIVHDNIKITRTMVLYSAYGLCSQTGTVVPYVDGDVFAKFQNIGFSGTLIVHNIESRPLALTRWRSCQLVRIPPSPHQLRSSA